MAFPVRMISEFADCIEATIDTSVKVLEFEDWVNLVAILSKVDCYVKFNEPDSKPFIHLANMAYNWFFPIKKLYVQAVSESGKFYAWGEKI
jgi:hypothetical protein